MRTLPVSLAFLLATLAAGPSRAAAQREGRAELRIGIGAVPSLPVAGPERGTGAIALGAVEVGGAGGGLRLRVEGGFAGQPLREDAAGQLTGDVQTVHAALALRAPVGARGWRVEPYLLGGAAVVRPSTRIRLRSLPSAVPDAAFTETRSEVVGGALVGAGLGWRTSRAHAFLEARWMHAATGGEPTGSLPLILGLAIPLRR